MVSDGLYQYHCIAGMWAWRQLQWMISDMAMFRSGMWPRVSSWVSRFAYYWNARRLCFFELWFLWRSLLTRLAKIFVLHRLTMHSGIRVMLCGMSSTRISTITRHGSSEQCSGLVRCSHRWSGYTSWYASYWKLCCAALHLCVIDVFNFSFMILPSFMF